MLFRGTVFLSLLCGFAWQASAAPQLRCSAVGGPQSVGIFLINLRNSPAPDGGFRDATLPASCNAEFLAGEFFAVDGRGSVNEFYQEMSGGMVRIVGKVIATLTIDDPEPDNRQCFSGPKLVQTVDAAAREMNLDFESFTRRVYITAARTGCRTAASGGPRASGAGVPVSIFGGACPAVSHIVHEIGHTFGLGHSMLDTEFGGGPWGMASQEAGDVMGFSGILTPFNAVHLDQLGWIPKHRKRTIEPAELQRGSIIDVYLSRLNIDDPANPDPRAVIVPFPDGSARSFHLSFRQPAGLDRNLDQEGARPGIAGGPYLNNLSIHWFDNYCPDVYGDENHTVQHRSFLLTTLSDGREFTTLGITFKQIGVLADRGSIHAQIIVGK